MENQSKIADLWLAELGLLGGNHDVAHHRELAAAAEGQAVNSSNGGQLALRYSRPRCAGELFGNDASEGALPQLGNVRPGCEGTAAAGDDDTAAALVLGGRVQYRGKLVQQLIAERIQGLGPVEGDDTDTALHLGQDHRLLLGGRGRHGVLQVLHDGGDAAAVGRHSGQEYRASPGLATCLGGTASRSQVVGLAASVRVADANEQ